MNLKIKPEWLEWIKKQWQPKPVNPPVVDPEIENLDPLQRSAEVIKYSILSIEFWISPKGQVREWLRNNTHMAAWLAVPTILVLPIILLAVVLVGAILAGLVGIFGNLIIFPILALLAGLVILIAIRIVKSIFGIK